MHINFYIFCEALYVQSAEQEKQIPFSENNLFWEWW